MRLRSTHALRRLTVLAPLLVIVLATLQARGAAPDDAIPHSTSAEPRIIDGGMFFGGEAVSEAEDVLRAVKLASGRDVVVETFAAVPEELREELARDGKDKFYEAWLNRLARRRGVRGVFVLMTREPGRVQVGVDRDTRQRVFTVADREALRDILVKGFRVKQFDRGLLDGVRFVRARIALNTAPDPNPTVPVTKSGNAKP